MDIIFFRSSVKNQVKPGVTMLKIFFFLKFSSFSACSLSGVLVIVSVWFSLFPSWQWCFCAFNVCSWGGSHAARAPNRPDADRCMARAASAGARRIASGVDDTFGVHGARKEAVCASRRFRVRCEPSFSWRDSRDAEAPAKPPAVQSRTGSSAPTVGVLIQTPCAVPDPNGTVQTPRTTLEGCHDR